MKGRTLIWAGMAVALGLLGGCSKKADENKAVREFQAEFVKLHDQGVREGFFECLYGEPGLPSDSATFIEKIKLRFDSDPAGFIEEKSEGCRVKLEEVIDQVRLLTAPDADIGSARDRYTDAATGMVDGWARVHQAFLDYQKVDDARIEFNATYAPLLEKAGNRGWALLQKCRMYCPEKEEPAEGAKPASGEEEPECVKDESVDACMARLGAGEEEKELAFRYINFILCILKVYDVDPARLLIADTKAVEEGRGYLLGVKALRDKLTELCTGPTGQSTNILEWSQRIAAQCYVTLDIEDPPQPEPIDQIVTWWSSDGTRVGGEAYSSYAVIGDTCLKQTVDLSEPLKAFLETYTPFAEAAAAMNDALTAAVK